MSETLASPSPKIKISRRLEENAPQGASGARPIPAPAPTRLPPQQADPLRVAGRLLKSSRETGTTLPVAPDKFRPTAVAHVGASGAAWPIGLSLRNKKRMWLATGHTDMRNGFASLKFEKRGVASRVLARAHATPVLQSPRLIVETPPRAPISSFCHLCSGVSGVLSGAV
jgi:hypothetical protein